MSNTLYVPAPPPQNKEDTLLYLNQELQRLSSILANSADNIMTEVYSEPLRPQNGQLIYADGSSWDPGSGRGLYFYKSGTGWVFVV